MILVCAVLMYVNIFGELEYEQSVICLLAFRFSYRKRRKTSWFSSVIFSFFLSLQTMNSTAVRKLLFSLFVL
jgi:hypothetical protein